MHFGARTGSRRRELGPEFQPEQLTASARLPVTRRPSRQETIRKICADNCPSRHALFLSHAFGHLQPRQRLLLFRFGFADAVTLLEHALGLSGRVLNQCVDHKAGIVGIVSDIVLGRQRAADLMVFHKQGIGHGLLLRRVVKTAGPQRPSHPINAEAARRFPESEVRLLVQHHAEHEQNRQPGEGIAKRTVFRDLLDQFHVSSPVGKKDKTAAADLFPSGCDYLSNHPAPRALSLLSKTRSLRQTASAKKPRHRPKPLTGLFVPASLSRCVHLQGQTRGRDFVPFPFILFPARCRSPGTKPGNILRARRLIAWSDKD